MTDHLAGQSESTPGNSLGAKLSAYAARFDEGEVLRWAFRGLLAGTIGVLAMDYYDLQQQIAAETPAIAAPDVATPLLPPVVDPQGPATHDPRTLFTGDRETLRQPIRFTLGAAGILEATGTIDPGASQRLANELDQRGEYVKVVSLNSPGGSVDDAMTMGKLLRDRNIASEVVDGALCASSCPLLLTGGVKRLVGKNAAIGVHQFYAVTVGGKPQSAPAQAMSDAQMTTARITRYLGDLGVDPALWLHAMDTPPQALYYLSTDELTKYRLRTGEPTQRRADPAS